MPEPEHISDQDLLLAAEDELSEPDLQRVETHLAECLRCRDRQAELESAMAEISRTSHVSLDPWIPPGDIPRTSLRARLAAQHIAHAPTGRFGWAAVAAALILAAATSALLRNVYERRAGASVTVTRPDPALTPGATVLLSKSEVCRQTSAKNKSVPVTLQRRVFDEYGIRNAEPSAYEVDYLITPALGGADDIHNLWPQSSASGIWNAQVKDMLEDHLRDLVCEGQLDLTVAQREIASDWIEAYKKYFHTDRPLANPSKEIIW